jgi:hypothetical protein
MNSTREKSVRKELISEESGKHLLQRIFQEKPIYRKVLKTNFICGIFSLPDYLAYLSYLSFLKKTNRLNQTVNLYE